MNMLSLPNQKRGGSTAQFPGKLHDMMDYVEKNGLEDAIAWVMDGQAFMINSPEKLVDILPMFFSQTKYRSFRRQLNGWRFERILDGPNRGAFHHPHFVKGKKVLCSYMTRNTCPSKKQRSNSNKNQQKITMDGSSTLPDKLKMNQANFTSFLGKSTSMHFGFDSVTQTPSNSNKSIKESSQQIISSVRQIMDEAASEIASTSPFDSNEFDNMFSLSPSANTTQAPQQVSSDEEDDNLGFFDIDKVFEDDSEQASNLNFLMEEATQLPNGFQSSELFSSVPVGIVTPTPIDDMDSFW